MLQPMPRKTAKPRVLPPEAVKFRQLRERKKLSRDDLAEMGGVHRNTIQKYETGERKLRLHIIDKFAPLMGATRDDVIATVGGIDRGESISIPECSMRLTQGGAFEMNEPAQSNLWVLPRRYLMDELRVPPGRLIIHEVHGDAMAPTLLAGDRVLVNLDDQRVSDAGIFLIADGKGDALRRLESVPGSKPALLKLICDNSRHGTYEVPEAAARVIGRVVWYARRM